MYLRNSKSFIPTQAVPIPRGRPQGRPQGICDPPGCRTFCQVVQSGVMVQELNHMKIRICLRVTRK